MSAWDPWWVIGDYMDDYCGALRDGDEEAADLDRLLAHAGPPNYDLDELEEAL